MLTNWISGELGSMISTKPGNKVSGSSVSGMPASKPSATLDGSDHKELGSD